MNNNVRTPWLKFYGDIPHTLTYHQGTMWNAVEDTAAKYPDYIAYDFMGKKTTYKQFVKEVELCARALKAIGVRAGDRITISMPNCPQTVIIFYAVNLVGAISNMVHPLSSEKEIEYYIKESQSIYAITLDQFYGKFEAIRQNVDLCQIIIARIKDALSPRIKAGYMLTDGRKIEKIPADAPVIFWHRFLRQGKGYNWKYRADKKAQDPAVILYSGGTTGVTKGILLSNLNFNALSAQVIATNPIFRPGDKMLAVMPMFHGFGLGVCIHSMLTQGGRCILVPRFTVESYAKLLKKYKCNLIAGVPTLYEALLHEHSIVDTDLSCLKGVFSGGDSLPIDLKKRFDRFLHAHNAAIQIREGYGTTECVTASCLTPTNMHKEGSIGIPFPDTFYKIVRPGTQIGLPYGEEGEICLAGPTVMIKYMNHPEETAQTLQRHADGLKWVHTGDLGIMDADGFIYFRQRIKRMIVTNGYNVYPSQLEQVIDNFEPISISCVIGVPDPLRMQRVKAFIVLKPGITATDELKNQLTEYCRKNIAKYAMPKEFEFRDSLPKTSVGKIAYRLLEEEEKQRLDAESKKTEENKAAAAVTDTEKKSEAETD